MSKTQNYPKFNFPGLLITKDYEIFLVKNDKAIEIPMTPLVKSLYLFFLIHPQGADRYELIEYRDRIYQIYRRLSTRSNLEQVKISIDLLVDRWNNSFNEKCAVVKARFLKHLDHSEAKSFYIQGPRRSKKTIPLDKERIHWIKPIQLN